jgi:hypothetical protein
MTSTLAGGEWSASCPGRFIPRERVLSTHWIGGWVDPEERKFLTLPGLKLWPLCCPAHSQLLYLLCYPSSLMHSLNMCITAIQCFVWTVLNIHKIFIGKTSYSETQKYTKMFIINYIRVPAKSLQPIQVFFIESNKTHTFLCYMDVSPIERFVY